MSLKGFGHGMTGSFELQRCFLTMARASEKLSRCILWVPTLWEINTFESGRGNVNWQWLEEDCRLPSSELGPLDSLELFRFKTFQFADQRREGNWKRGEDQLKWRINLLAIDCRRWQSQAQDVTSAGDMCGIRIAAERKEGTGSDIESGRMPISDRLEWLEGARATGCDTLEQNAQY